MTAVAAADKRPSQAVARSSTRCQGYSGIQTPEGYCDCCTAILNNLRTLLSYSIFKTWGIVNSSSDQPGLTAMPGTKPPQTSRACRATGTPAISTSIFAAFFPPFQQRSHPMVLLLGLRTACYDRIREDRVQILPVIRLPRCLGDNLKHTLGQCR